MFTPSESSRALVVSIANKSNRYDKDKDGDDKDGEGKDVDKDGEGKDEDIRMVRVKMRI